jgi:hypothetical protein
MKTICNILTLSLALASVTVRAQLANYQGTVSGQNPVYYFHLDNSFVDSVGGTAVLTNSTVGDQFGSDYFGNGSSAASFTASSDFLTGSPSILSGAGTSTAVGSLSLLFYVPAVIPTTGYYFSDSETTGGAANGQPGNSAFAFQISSAAGALTLKAGNTSITGLPTVTANTWYYLALTYNLTGTAATNGVNWYLGAVGGSLFSGFKPKGGSGNISSTATLGDGLTFVVGNKQSAVTVGPTSTAGVTGGEVDELATWTTQLGAAQITDQFGALVVPEPSALALIGLGGLMLIGVSRLRGAGQCRELAATPWT